MSMKTEKDFLEWLYGASFYHGTTRYGQFPGYHIFVTRYDSDDELRQLVDDLEGGDVEALDAGYKLAEMQKIGEIWLAYNDNPAVAMIHLVAQIRGYYFNILNKDDQ
jgi:hypothetical protein